MHFFKDQQRAVCVIFTGTVPVSEDGRFMLADMEVNKVRSNNRASNCKILSRSILVLLCFYPVQEE